VRELEGELEAEQRRHADAQKTVRRQERRIQELTQLSEDEEKARDAERETIEKLQSKMKQYKRELDDAVSHCPSFSMKSSRLAYAYEPTVTERYSLRKQLIGNGNETRPA